MSFFSYLYIVNEYFEDKPHWQSLVPDTHDPYKKSGGGKPILKKSGYRYKNQDKYEQVDISQLLPEIESINWDYVMQLKKTVKKGNTCPYCNINPSTTRDHVISALHRKAAKYQKIKFNKKANLIILCCRTCNSKKGSYYPSEWLVIVNAIIDDESRSKIDYYVNIKKNLERIIKRT